MKATFPKTVTVEGIPKLSATIYRNRQVKGVTKYINYTLAYPLLGKLRRQTFSDLDEAIATGKEAIIKIANNEQRVLELSNSQLDEYLRAKEILKPRGLALDVVAERYLELLDIL